MTYADSGQGFRDGGRYRDEPDNGAAPGYQSGSYPVDDYSAQLPAPPPAGGPRRPVSAAELDEVFDDPDEGEPGMDRMVVHIIWEVLLLAGCVGVFVLFRQTHRAGVSGTALQALLLTAAALGFVAVGTALSLRAAAVNLAVGPIAAAAALFFASHSDRNLPATVGVTVLLAAAAGAVIAGLVVGL